MSHFVYLFINVKECCLEFYLKMDNMRIKKIGRIQMICSQTIHFHEVTVAAVLTIRGKSKFTCRSIKVLLPLMMLS